MQVQMKTWGNSQGIRISKELMEQAGIHLDDPLIATASDGQIIISKEFRHITLEERAAAYAGKLNLDGEVDFGEPVGREVW